jgi:hypothetical protein
MVLSRREPARLINSDSTDKFTLGLLESAELDAPAANAASNAVPRVTALMARDKNLVDATHIREVHPNNKVHSIRPETKRITRAAAVGILLGSSLAAAVVGARHSTVFVTSTPTPTSVKQPANSSSPRQARPALVREVPKPTPAVPSAPISSQPREAKVVRPSTHDLGQELALLDAAKAALSAGSPEGALRSLDDAAALPRRVLTPEATVLRIKALVALGRTTQARHLVNSFIAQNPNSPVNAILHDLVAPFQKQ